MSTDNKNSYITVTEDDIRYVEKILFPSGGGFDSTERIPIIKNFTESIDVNACPGSGKTTVLLAKLMILLKKLPLDNGKGVCVITHTNVAVDEIKNRLGSKGEILFKYPNFVGTIQQFIDKFLAIPFFKNINGINIKSIDDDIYYDTVKKLLSLDFLYPNLKRMIEFSLKKGSYTKKSFQENMVTFISLRHIKFIDKSFEIVDKNGRINKMYYEELKKIMIDFTFNKVILRYEDAMVLGEAYLKKHPQLELYFQNRFQYVFIDEMQDTKKNHQNIFSKIFKPDKVILQRFGDINQNLGQGKGNDECGWDLSLKSMPINSSKRYGESLVKFISPLRVKRDGTMTGNEQVETISPHIIIFDDTNIESVINSFNKILVEHEIKESDNNKIKIIGKVGISVPSPYISIKSYIKTYNKQNKNKSLNIKKCKKLKQSKTLKEFYENLLSILILKITINSKTINKDEFKKICETDYYEEFMLYRSKVIKWYGKIKNDFSKVLLEIYEESVTFLEKINEICIKTEELKEYFTYENISKEQGSVDEGIASNDKFEANTIFGTKGETHLATLYLETYYNSYGKDRSDISRILQYMLDKKEEIDQNDEEALTHAYVAMSRATKLLCIAVRYDTIKGRIKEFSDYGYIIRGCDEKINNLIKEETGE